MNSITCKIEYLVVVSFTFAFEFWLTLAFIENSIAIPLLGLMHLCVTTLVMAWAWLRPWEDRRIPVTLAMATAFLGVLGVFGALIAFLVSSVFRKEHRDVSEWLRFLFPESKRSEKEQVYDEMLREKKAAADDGTPDIAPMVDVLRRGTMEQKVEIVGYLARRFHPRFAPALHLALNDSESAIRVQAAAIASKVGSAHGKRITELKKALRDSPNDADVQVALAREYDDYAHEGLLPEESNNEMRENAIQLYKNVLNQGRDNEATRIALMRILIRSNRPEEALALIKRCGGDPTSMSPEVLTWALEAYYQEGRFQDLRRVAGILSSKLDANRYPVSLIEALSFWEGGNFNEASS